MPRIAGINIPEQKQIKIALTYIYGVGKSLSKKILAEADINPDRRASDLNAGEVNKLREIIEKRHKTEGDLRRDKITNIKRLKEISSWRGMRHAKGLPVRGQTSRVNNRTVRGNIRKTVGSGRKEAPSPK
jgi:small subunit ribosomal protein S13